MSRTAMLTLDGEPIIDEVDADLHLDAVPGQGPKRPDQLSQQL